MTNPFLSNPCLSCLYCPMSIVLPIVCPFHFNVHFMVNSLNFFIYVVGPRPIHVCSLLSTLYMQIDRCLYHCIFSAPYHSRGGFSQGSIACRAVLFWGRGGDYRDWGGLQIAIFAVKNHLAPRPYKRPSSARSNTWAYRPLIVRSVRPASRRSEHLNCWMPRSNIK